MCSDAGNRGQENISGGRSFVNVKNLRQRRRARRPAYPICSSNIFPYPSGMTIMKEADL